MTALAGAVSWDSARAPQLLSAVSRLLQRQSLLGTTAVFETTNAVVGSNAKPCVPVDVLRLDRNGLTLLVVSRGAPDPDPRWNAVAARWTGNPDALRDVPGVWSAAIWSGDRNRLWLARSVLSPFGLHVRRTETGAMFASLAPALFADRDSLDVDRLARSLVAPGHADWAATAVSTVRLVRPGTCIAIDRDRCEERRFWSAHDYQPPRFDDAEAARELRAALVASVRRHVAATDRPVSTQLSAGRDSGAVTAITARVLAERGATVDAFTSVPDPALGMVSGHRIVDEGPGAAALAALHPNINHHRVATGRIALADQLDRCNALLAAPHESAINLGWWSTIMERVRAAGGALLFEATLGNYAISAGGPWALPDVLHDDGIAAWWTKVRAARAHPRASWPNLLFKSVAPWLPSAMARATRQARHPGTLVDPSSFLAGDFAAHVAERERHRTGDRHPLFRAELAYQVEAHDGFDPCPAALHDIDLRDPTADRHLVETSLAFSARQIAGPYDHRPIYDAAFSKDVAPCTLRPGGWGMQAADWALAVDPLDLARALRRYADNPAVPALVDVDAMLTALADWPATPLVDGPDFQRFTHLLRVFSIASWLNHHR